MHKDELWQVYAPNGEPLAGDGWDSALNNPEETGSDAIVGVTAVFLYRFNDEGELELLWQRRSDVVDRYPGDYDVSAGGHINQGESLTAAAARECREEIGAVVAKEDLRFVTMRSYNRNRFAWVYAVDWTGREEAFRFDDGEASEVRWVPFAETDEFLEKFAKAPLKKDRITFVILENWFEIQGLIDVAEG